MEDRLKVLRKRLREKLPEKRSSRCICYNPEFSSENGDKLRWVEHIRDGLRFLGKVHEIRDNRVNHCGWYTDDMEDSGYVCYGIVAQMPARGGKPVYVPGYQFAWEVWGTDDDNAVLCFGDNTSDLSDVIRWADQMAGWAADTERENQRQARLELNIEEGQERLLELRNQIRAEVQTLRGFHKWMGYATNLFGEGPPIGMRDGIASVLAGNIKRLRQEMYKIGGDIKKWRMELIR